jgi:prophage regulatory protein
VPKIEKEKKMHKQQSVRPIFIRTSQLKEITGLSPTTVWRREKEGIWPKRRRLEGCSGWLYSEIEEFLKNCEQVA